MQLVNSDEFWQRATAVRVGIDPRYPQSGCLSLLPPTDHGRFWTVPSDPAIWPHWIGTLIDGLDEWTTGYLWPRGGQWPSDTHGANNEVRNVILHGVGIPQGWDGAVQITHDEIPILVTVLYVAVAFGWNTDDDFFFLPDHGRQLLQTDHHDVIHVQCRTEARVLELVAHMQTYGYELPTELPDATFRRPAWMVG